MTNKGLDRVYSRSSREWVTITVHRAGSATAPNAMHIGDGYMTGTSGYPVPILRWCRADGTEVARYRGGFSPTEAYQEGDYVQARVYDLSQISVFYIRYNQVKELAINLGDLVNTRTIGMRRNYTTGIGHADLSNLHYLQNLDFSDVWSVTQITVSPQAPINFYYVQGTSIDQANVDYLLQMAVDSGILNGTLAYSGRPSYDAWDNYDLLASRGWNLSLSPVAGTLELLGYTSAGASNGIDIIASHRITFYVRNADGTIRHQGAFSSSHAGGGAWDFVEDGWIETEYYHPSILMMRLDGKQLKTLQLSQYINAQNLIFNNNNITSVDLTSNVELEQFQIANNPLTSITGIANTKLTYLNLLNTGMNGLGIAGVMADLVAAGTLNGTFEYSVQPDSSAAEDYLTLIDRGWTLSIAPVINATPAAGVIGFVLESNMVSVSTDQNAIPVTVTVGKQDLILTQYGATASTQANVTTTNLVQQFVISTPDVTVVAEQDAVTDGNYYVDAVSGSDTNSGSISNPWQTAAKLRSFTFPTGATVHFKGGQTHADFWLDIGGGNITLMSYDTATNGIAILDATDGTALYGESVENLLIENLDIKGDGRLINTGDGISIYTGDANNTQFQNITIRGCKIHGFGNDGIQIGGYTTEAGFGNVTIENNEIYDIRDRGIFVYGNKAVGYANANFTVQGNEVYQITGYAKGTHSGNGILLSNVHTAFIQDNVIHDCGADQDGCGGNAAAWGYDCDTLIIQENIAYNISSGTGCDGAGFDLDGGCVNSRLQFNYAYNCQGAGVMCGQFVGAKPMSNNRIRYNIIENCASTQEGGIYLFNGQNTGDMDSIYVHNNTVYHTNVNTNAVLANSWNGGITNCFLENNVLIGQISIAAEHSVTIGNNHSNPNTTNFTNAGAGVASGYQFNDTSELIDAGSVLSYNNSSMDYFGNIPNQGNAPDIGAYESPYTASGGGGGSYDSDYQAVLDYATANSIVHPSEAQRQRDSDLIVALKNNGYWSKCDVFLQFMGDAPAAFKLICWKRKIQADAFGSFFVGFERCGR